MKWLGWFLWGALGPIAIASMGYSVMTNWGHWGGWDYTYIVCLAFTVLNEGVQEVGKHVDREGTERQ